MKRLSQIGIASGVLLAGFAAGRWTPATTGKHPAAPAPAVEKEASKKGRSNSRDLDGLLCEVATGKLAGGRERIAALAADPVANQDELVKLLVAIALKDGATFDQVFAGLPGEEKEELISQCLLKLSNEPDRLMRLFVDSKVIASSFAGDTTPFYVLRAVGNSPDLFLDLVESGELPMDPRRAWLAATNLNQNKAVALRFLQLCQSGKIPVPNELVVAPFISNLSDGDLAKLRAGTVAGDLAEMLAQEEQARAFFADENLRGKTWKVGLDYIFENGMKQLIERSGVPDMEWSEVPEGFRADLSKSMLTSALGSKGGQGASDLLDSISKSNLPAAEKDKLLEDSARALFTQYGQTGLAVDYAHRISGGGEDLIVEWVTYDPANAKAYVDKIEPSPLRDRLMARIQEVSP
jgi:hypothetical protein